SHKTWTKERVSKQIRKDIRRGLPVTSVAVIRRNQPLYGAGRREFGSWRAALKAVDPSLTKLLWKRGSQAIADRRSKPASKSKATSRAPSSRSGDVLQLKITLMDIHPPVWRRIQVPATTTLAKLHALIQVVMPWTNSHMHEFTIGRERYG